MTVHEASMAPHLEGLQRGELLISYCSNCLTSNFPPTATCRQCRTEDHTRWRPIDPVGSLWSFATFHKQYDAHFPLATPYVVAIVELAEDIQLYTNVIEVPAAELRIGMHMRGKFSEIHPGEVRLHFIPDEGTT